MNKGSFEFELWVKKAPEVIKKDVIKKVKIDNRYEALTNDSMDVDEEEDIQMLDMVFRRQEQ